MEKALGIPYIVGAYIEAKPTQNKTVEFAKIQSFLKDYVVHFASKNNLVLSDFDTQFINYGKTELVYVLTVQEKERYTLLVGQPILECGKVFQEAENLKELHKVDKNVVAPIDYFSSGNHELYVTPYINQARCIASYGNNWGMYVPEPHYRFVEFNFAQQRIVNTCMIAKIVSLYDDKTQSGISNCKLGGGDFMLPKGWENESPTIESTLNSILLIAARDKINCSFEEYKNLIRKEFSQITIDKDGFKLNIRGRVAMSNEEIENGIKIGCKIKDEINKSKDYH